MPHNGERLAGRNLQPDIAQHFRSVARIAKREPLKRDGSAYLLGNRGSRVVLNLRRSLQDLQHSAHGSGAALKDVNHPADGDRRPGEHGEIAQESHKFSQAQMPGNHLPPSQPQQSYGRQTDQTAHEGIKGSPEAYQGNASLDVIPVQCLELPDLGLLARKRLYDADAGQVLLRHVADHRELILNAFKAIVDLLAEVFHGERNQRQWHVCQQGQLRVDPQEDDRGDHHRHECRHRVHDSRTQN